MIFTLMAAEQEARRRRDFYRAFLELPHQDHAVDGLQKANVDWKRIYYHFRAQSWRYGLLAMKFRGGWMRRVLAADKGISFVGITPLFEDAPGVNPNLRYPEAAGHIIDMFGPV
jgi:hypothetical protein